MGGDGRRGPSEGGFELVLAAAGAVVVATAGAVWAGAWLAARAVGGQLDAGLGDALLAMARLAQAPGDPASAWVGHTTARPATWLYWGCTAAVAATVVGLAATAWWTWRRWSPGRRAQVGVPFDARVARRRDVRRLVVPSTVPPRGRMVLGRLAPRGPVLATEDRGPSGEGDRGSVALIGPTRSGKSVAAATGLIGWDGPVVALSVKRDLYDATAGARALRGEIAVFDPGRATGLPTARWTPLRDVTTTTGAARAARALSQAIPRHGVNGGDFWALHGQTLIGAYMALAGLSQLLPPPSDEDGGPLAIDRLAEWAYTHVGLSDPTVNDLVRRGLEVDRPLETRLLARDAATKLKAFAAEDPRIRASIYATARLALDPWTEPSVAHSASTVPRPSYDSDEEWKGTPLMVDLEWLMAGGEDRANTLYLAAPPTEFARLAPVLGGLLGDLREQIHAWDVGGRRLPKPLLLVIDEAGQLELQWLAEEVSTIAGLGGMIVTCWQSRAQIAHRYGTLSDAVVGGHRSKVFFSGIDDPATLDYVTRVAGTKHVAQRGWSADTWGGRRTVSEHVQREDLLPVHIIRQMRRQHAVLIHGNLPPAHVRPVQWWADRDLRRLVPVRPDGSVEVPTGGTCPMEAGTGTEAGSDPGT